MKRINNLYPQIYSFENLLQAYKKAKKGTKTKESIAFEFHAEKELLQLADELKNHTYKPSPYRFFTIYEPKEREISVASFRDRIVHHAIVTILEPIYDNLFISDTYANRKGKGTHAAIRRFKEFSKKNKYVIKADIRKYFPSIVHSILKTELRKTIKCKDTLFVLPIQENVGIIRFTNLISVQFLSN